MTVIFRFSLIVVFLLSTTATAYTSEFLEIDLPIFGTYRFRELTSYYILQASPLLNYDRISEAAWDAEIRSCLSKFGPAKTRQFEQALTDWGIAPHNFLPLLRYKLQDREHTII